MNYITDIHQVNTSKLSTLMTASLQAYNAFSDKHPAVCQSAAIKPPAGFVCVTCWTGIDSLFTHDKTEEIFGVVFRSKQAPYTYIFAFRGTASILDILDDLGAEHRSFKPYDAKQHVSSEVEAEAGFYDIYTEQTATVKPMQQQLFELLDQYQQSDKPIAELWITGHSLGSSLSTLFSLDVGLSRPDIRATNINFACPRTGNQAFVDLFEQTLKPHNTLRVQNTYDAVPCVPLEDMGYAHTPWALLLAFYEKGFIDQANLLARHSALNYQAVINCAKQSSSGVCLNDDLHDKDNGDQLVSVQPSSSNLCEFYLAHSKTD
ncbi:lipase family protein [Marinicella sediminis]|uniref:Lipase family protein n=1 Tax=Marinicella sediminis TaxID=1792834 RepID=A0ABV7J4N2_9GAMM|nr:lipase family protein [Marinicella sediminis]